MGCELGKITLYMSKAKKTFKDVVDKTKVSEKDTSNFKVRTFKVDGVGCKFYCQQVINNTGDNPPWLDFVNESLDDDKTVEFQPKSERPSGLILIEKNNRIFAATFGSRGSAWLNKKAFESDFGIIVAMNLCGNSDVRQAKSAIQAYTTQVIDRQQSRPSDTFEFGMSEVELLRFISAHLKEDRNITLQGKDCLTVKIIGEDKISWEKLFKLIDSFDESYQSDDYKGLFPNYPNLSPVDDKTVDKLNQALINKLKKKNLTKIHLAIPEFISDDRYSYAYRNMQKRENRIFSHVTIEDLYSEVFKSIDDITLKALSNKCIFAYSHDEDKILDYLKWEIFNCLVAELKLGDDYFILSLGEWRKVDDDFYQAIESFIENELRESNIEERFNNINIACTNAKQNRESKFNDAYCELNPNTIKFDTAKLRIGKAKKDKEFCDILEVHDDGVDIIQVKKYAGCSSINYLFSQTRFYCEFFLTDEVFLSEIRTFIDQQDRDCKNLALEYIKPSIEEVFGSDYSVKMWLLYDQSKKKPDKCDLPLMAKYELKLTYEKLRKYLKFKQVTLSMVPVKMIKFTTAK